MIIYDGDPLIPAPFVNMTSEQESDQDGNLENRRTTITLTGKIVAYKGSPSSTGVFWNGPAQYPPDEIISGASRLTAIVNKQNAIKKLFSEDYKWLEIQGWDGFTPFKVKPRVKSIDFAEGPWYETCDYTITLEADEHIPGKNVESSSEEWQVEEEEFQNRYRVTHTISATGRTTHDPVTGDMFKAWKNAREWVMARLGQDAAVIAAPNPTIAPPAYLGYNHAITYSYNEEEGNYQVTENWILADMPAYEDYSIEQKYSLEQNTQSVSISGTITGMEDVNSKDVNAMTLWSTISAQLFTRAQALSGLTLNPTAIDISWGRNPLTGIITYNRTYDNRPLSLVPGAISESITITENYPVPAFASIPVVGRLAGPVLQYLGTQTERKRSLAIEVVMPASTILSVPAIPNIVNIILANAPVGYAVFVDGDQETWSSKTGRYSRNVSWTYEL